MRWNGLKNKMWKKYANFRKTCVSHIFSFSHFNLLVSDKCQSSHPCPFPSASTTHFKVSTHF